MTDKACNIARYFNELKPLRHQKMTAAQLMNIGADRLEKAHDRISQLEADNAALMKVARKAECIKHWHDAMADNSGMVVSADAVRELWSALSALPAHLKEEASE